MTPADGMLTAGCSLGPIGASGSTKGQLRRARPCFSEKSGLVFSPLPRAGQLVLPFGHPETSEFGVLGMEFVMTTCTCCCARSFCETSAVRPVPRQTILHRPCRVRSAALLAGGLSQLLK